MGEVTSALTIRSLELEAYIPYIFIAMIFCFPTRNLFKKAFAALDNMKAKAVALPYNVVTDLVYVAAFACCIIFVIGGSYNPFIYFRF